jgi:hypothetical protein
MPRVGAGSLVSNARMPECADFVVWAHRCFCSFDWVACAGGFQVRNHELFYEAINFYLDEHPLSLGKLLQVLTTKLDHARVVHQLRRSDNLPLILPFMKSVQKVRGVLW